MPDNKILYRRGQCSKNTAQARIICKNTTQNPEDACEIDYSMQCSIKIDYSRTIDVDKESLSRISRNRRILEKIAELL